MKITIGHVRYGLIENHDLHLYCGRSKTPQGMINASLGNPFRMNNESERDAVVEAYDEWLHSPLGVSHRRVIDRIIKRSMEGKKVALYCHCAPAKCHCDVIKEYVETNVQFG